MEEKISAFKITPRILFGKGSSLKAAAEVKRLGGAHVLFVVDPGCIKAGLFDGIQKSFKKEDLQMTVFDGVEPEPQIEVADECGQLARDKGCDFIVGMGGGSAMDTAKAASILLTNSGKIKDYQGLGMVKKPGVPKIMIPTTAGTGSEVTFTAVFTDKAGKTKAGVNSDYLFADTAVLDPLLTVSLPPRVTAFTGMDALTHAIEAYTSLSSNSLSDLFALKAIELISMNLYKAVVNGQDYNARDGMLKGSLFGGIALANAGVGAAHALAYPLGGEFHVPHGVANGLLLPYVMEFNLKSTPEKFSRIAEVMRGEGKHPSGSEPPEKSIAKVHKLIEDIQASKRLKELGIPESALERLSLGAMKVERPIENNPRKVNKEDAIAIYKKAY